MSLYVKHGCSLLKVEGRCPCNCIPRLEEEASLVEDAKPKTLPAAFIFITACLTVQAIVGFHHNSPLYAVWSSDLISCSSRYRTRKNIDNNCAIPLMLDNA